MLSQYIICGKRFGFTKFGEVELLLVHLTTVIDKLSVIIYIKIMSITYGNLMTQMLEYTKWTVFY